MKHLKTINLLTTKGTKTIAQASDVFTSYIDSDFKKWNLDVQDKPTKAVNLDVFEMDKNGTFKDIFTNPDKQVMTQEQIIYFCKNHKEELHKDWYTFFLFKRVGVLFVACVSLDDLGRLGVRVDPFSYDRTWLAECPRRFVAPQLVSKTLENPDSLKLSNFVT